MQTYSACAPKLLDAEHLVPDLELGDGCADRLDLAGQLHPEDLPLRTAETGEEAADEDFGAAKPAVRPVDGRGVDLDQDLVVVGDGPLDLLESQNLRWPVPVVDNGSHAFTSSLRALKTMDRATVAPCPPGSIELRGPAAGRAGPRSASGRDHPTVLRDDAAPEVRGVELHPPEGLVHRPQLGQGERRPDERRRDTRHLELDTDTLDRISHDLQVVERQVDLAVQQIGDRNEGRCCSVRARLDLAHIANHCEVADGDDVHAWVAPGIAVGAELGQRDGGVDACLLAQLPPRRLVQRLAGTLETARDRPHPLERRLTSTHEQGVQQALGHRQDHHVDCHRECREPRWVVIHRHAGPSGFCPHDSYPSRWFWSCRPQLLKVADCESRLTATSWPTLG